MKFPLTLFGNILTLIDLNHWLVENGWAFPTYYNSMSVDEIKAIQKLSEAARKAKRGIWPHMIHHVSQLNLGMLFRPKGKPNDKSDVGPVLMPKIFRRQVRFVISQLNHLPAGAGDFRSFLGAQPDPFVTLSAFFKNPKIKAPGKNSPNRNLTSVVNAQEVFAPMPGDLVFFEMPSTLVDNNGKKITQF
ncbi:MAG: thermonuclease family protein [Acidobacteriota bacterium]|nr:thermonuclease family protein [Acidobacteriota bacterium]